MKIKNSIKNIILKLAQKYQLFIISSNETKNIADYLNKNSLKNVFSEILDADINKSKIEKFKILFNKYNLNSSNCIFITDTLGDIIEARKLNIKSVGVDFGYHNFKTLSRGNPFKIISDLTEIFDIINND